MEKNEWMTFTGPGRPSLCSALQASPGQMLIPPAQSGTGGGFISIICTCISALAIGQTIKDTIFTQLTGGSNIGPLILCPLDFHGLNLNGF
jgi:hypothetical protein